MSRQDTQAHHQLWRSLFTKNQEMELTVDWKLFIQHAAARGGGRACGRAAVDDQEKQWSCINPPDQAAHCWSPCTSSTTAFPPSLHFLSSWLHSTTSALSSVPTAAGKIAHLPAFVSSHHLRPRPLCTKVSRAFSPPGLVAPHWKPFLRGRGCLQALHGRQGLLLPPLWPLHDCDPHHLGCGVCGHSPWGTGVCPLLWKLRWEACPHCVHYHLCHLLPFGAFGAGIGLGLPGHGQE